jgi:hypothetical protein
MIQVETDLLDQAHSDGLDLKRLRWFLYIVHKVATNFVIYVLSGHIGDYRLKLLVLRQFIIRKFRVSKFPAVFHTALVAGRDSRGVFVSGSICTPMACWVSNVSATIRARKMILSKWVEIQSE